MMMRALHLHHLRKIECVFTVLFPQKKILNANLARIVEFVKEDIGQKWTKK